MEPQQSTQYADYMKRLHWQVVSVDGSQIFIRKFPFFGGMAKIHRPEKLPDTQRLLPVLKQYGIKTLVIEPVMTQNQKQLNSWHTKLSRHVHISTTPYLPTKTIRVDLTRKEDDIFRSFSEAKRRAVRRATKLGVRVEKSDSIDDLIRIKNKSSGLFGFITTTGIREFWSVFHPDHAAILLAYTDTGYELLGGVLLLFWDGVAYYWIAGAVKKGKKLFAPTLLVWEAMKISKKYHCILFDFVGIWDDRLPAQNTEWKGFTKFKEGFGGNSVSYPLVPRHP